MPKSACGQNNSVMAEDLISVITPVYNGADYLAEAIRSVQAQTHTEWEYILVDDGSTDGSAEIMREFCTADRRIRMISNAGNRGIPYSRNTGLADAGGAWIAFLDQDDIFLPDKLAVQLAVLQADEGLGLIACDCERINAAGEVYAVKTTRLKADVMRQIIFRNPIETASLILVRRACFDTVGAFDEAFRGNDDRDMYIRIAARYSLASVDRVLARKREHAANTVKAIQLEMYDEWLQIIGKTAAANPAARAYAKKAEAVVHLNKGRHYYVKGQRGRARQLFLKAFRTRPGLRALAHILISLTGPLGYGLYRLKRALMPRA
ncbi:glycosyltransferase family 2 protein [Planctomycetota bacterium]